MDSQTSSTLAPPTPEATRTSYGSHRFRESTHLIPTIDAEKKAKRFDPFVMSLPVVIGTPLLLFAIGVALEVGVMIGYKRGGFSVPPQNVFNFVSPQFLLAFFPTLIVVPYAVLWRELDWRLRLYQPYIVLSKGNAIAEESLLLDYIGLGPILAMFRALKYKHRIIFLSAATASITYLFQSLAGSIFQIRQRPKVYYSSVTSIKSLGLAPDVDQLNAFVSAAGFAEAAVFHNLSDPPFVQRGWATAEFTFPPVPGLNGTMVVNTTGVQSNPQCENPVETNVNVTSDAFFTISSKSVDGCTHVVNFNPQLSTQQYGVDDVDSCPQGVSQNVTFRPVMFWYYHTKNDGTPQAKTVFCSPTIAAFNVTATSKLSDGTFYNVTGLNNYVADNNVTGGELAGRAFNGVIFNPNPDPFIQARANTTRSAVPGAIFRFASQLPNGPQSTFDLPNGFLDITRRVYTQHLSLTAKSIYFVNQNTTLPAQMTSIVPVLWIDALPAHLLALLLIITGLIGLFIQILHRRERKKLLLAAPPGSIASIVSLTSRSGFGELLVPYDDERALERKLEGLRFRVDRRTGAIVVDESGTERDGMGPDEAMLSLLGHQRDRQTAASMSSSILAFQAAAGYPQWKYQAPLKTPYDR